MLTITPKTTRADLIAEITHLREQTVLREHEDAQRTQALTLQRDDARERAAHAEHKVEVLETDVHNMLGTIRVMADSSREVRIRKASVRDSDLCYALPVRNTDKL